MDRIAAWLAAHAPDVHRSLLPPPSPEKIRWAMTELGADASPAVEDWLRRTGGQEWANAPDGALPPYMLFSVDELVWNTVDLREDGTLPPRAAVVAGYDFDEPECFLLLDAAGIFWKLENGEITKVADNAEQLLAQTLQTLEQDRPELRGWLPNEHQTMGDGKLLAVYAALAVVGCGALTLAWRAEAMASIGWAAVGGALLWFLIRALWLESRGRAWNRAVAQDLAASPDEPWRANAHWRRNEAFTLDSGAPRVQLAEVPMRFGAAAVATVDAPNAEARLESIHVLLSRFHCVTYPLEEHTCECRAEGAQTVITLLAPETWPTRLPGRYPNRAILWQLTLFHNGREYRYWLPIFD